MKKFGWAIVITIIIFFISILVIEPIISNLGYSSVESSYHLATHALLVSLILTVIICTMIILSVADEIKVKLDQNKKNNDKDKNQS